jgi:chemotaxis protein methyltransferase CheR
VSSTVPSPKALVDDPQFPVLKEQLLESTGLSYYIDKDDDLSRRVERRLSKTGAPDCASYLKILGDPVRGPSELDALISEVTIGETYFFRHREQFDALRDTVLPNLIAQNHANRRLRVWCAGCADGPEPYSIAILLKQEMEHRFTGWNVTILGTDINRNCLARAREGKFEEWAFRSTPEEVKHKCFLKEGRLWTIAPEYKEWISFQYHNLAEDSFPSQLDNLFCFDLIICRNVMIYFGPDLMRKLIQRFHDCLTPGAWLLVGPSEPNMTFFSSFHAVNAPGTTLYQRPHTSICHEKAEEWTQESVTQLLSFPEAPISVTPPAIVDESPSALLEEVRRHADRGDLESALARCAELLKQDNLNARVYFFQALILNQMDRHAEAEQSVRRTIYLDRQSVLAHYYLGLFLQSRGESPLAAARPFENALELLSSFAEDYVFVDADGITAAELKKLAETNLKILREGNETSSH